MAPISAPLLDWAIENLLKNGLDAIDKDEGVVELRCHFDAASDAILLTVRDNGKGMSSQVRERVFDPGFSTKQRGWGMGLALVRRIAVEVHGGGIGIPDSQEGQGSTFRIRLPVR